MKDNANDSGYKNFKYKIKKYIDSNFQKFIKKERLTKKNSSSSILSDDNNKKKDRSLSDKHNINSFEKDYFDFSFNKKNPISIKVKKSNTNYSNKFNNNIQISNLLNNSKIRKKKLILSLDNNGNIFDRKSKTKTTELEKYNSFRTRNYIKSRNKTNERSIGNQSKVSLQTIPLNNTFQITNYSTERKNTSIPQNNFKTFDNSNSIISEKNEKYSNFSNSNTDEQIKEKFSFPLKKNSLNIKKQKTSYNFNNNISKRNSLNQAKQFKEYLLNDNLDNEIFNEIYKKNLTFKGIKQNNKFLNKFENEINSQLKEIENRKNDLGKKLVYKQLKTFVDKIIKLEKNILLKERNTMKGFKDNLEQILNSFFRTIKKKDSEIFLYKMFKYLKLSIAKLYIRKNNTINYEFIHNNYLDIRENSLYYIFNKSIPFDQMNNEKNFIKSKNLNLEKMNLMNKSIYCNNDFHNKTNYDIKINKIRNLISIANKYKTNFLFFQDIWARDLKLYKIKNNKKKNKNIINNLESKNLNKSKNYKKEIIDNKKKGVKLKNLLFKFNKTRHLFNNLKKNNFLESNLIGDLKYQKIKQNFYKNIFEYIEKENEIQLKNTISDNIGFININYIDENGNTFLNYASKLNCKIEIIKFLLLNGCSPNICNVKIFFLIFFRFKEILLYIMLCPIIIIMRQIC